MLFEFFSKAEERGHKRQLNILVNCSMTSKLNHTSEIRVFLLKYAFHVMTEELHENLSNFEILKLNCQKNLPIIVQLFLSQTEELLEKLDATVTIAGLSKTYGASFFKKLFDCKFLSFLFLQSDVRRLLDHFFAYANMRFVKHIAS